jgi:hypothetical protein
MDNSRRRHRAPSQRSDTRSALMALTIAVVFLALATVIVVVAVPAVLSCPSATEKELAQQEAFVRSQFADARDVRSGVSDCDTGGGGYVVFETDLSPAAARASLLADSACSDPENASGDIAAQCRSSKKLVNVFFTKYVGGDVTAGSLEFD